MPPMKGKGIRKPNNARLGIVCITLATPSTGARNDRWRVNRIPVGTPMSTATTIAIATSLTCCQISRSSSDQLSWRKCQKLILVLQRAWQRIPHQDARRSLAKRGFANKRAPEDCLTCENLRAFQVAPTARDTSGRCVFPAATLHARRALQESRSCLTAATTPRIPAASSRALTDRVRQTAHRATRAVGGERARVLLPRVVVVRR